MFLQIANIDNKSISLEKDSDIKPRTPEQEAFACEMREFLQSLVDMGMEDCEDEDIYDSDEDIAE